MVLAACQNESWSGEIPVPDRAMFEAEVYPVLLRDCGFNACHGDPARFLLVFGPGRMRVDPSLEMEMQPSPLEIEISYERARSMLVTTGSASASLLLTKPLQQQAGGVSHLGVDDFGRNVYQSTLAPGYATLVRWVQTATTAAAGAGGASAQAGTAGGTQ